MKQPIFEYKEDYVKCTVIDNLGRKFIGEARCHPDDKDFSSQITGSTIAEMRSRIEAAVTYKNDLKMKLSSLKQLQSCMRQSKKFNPKSYENIMLTRQINLLESDLDIAKHQIAVLKLDLFEYMQSKEEVHQYLRKHAKPANS